MAMRFNTVPYFRFRYRRYDYVLFPFGRYWHRYYMGGTFKRPPFRIHRQGYPSVFSLRLAGAPQYRPIQRITT